MKRVWPITSNTGGLSSDLKQGPPNSFGYSRHLDHRKNATLMTLLPATLKDSGTTITGTVTEMVQLPSGKIVMIDSSGGVYTRSTAGVYAKNGTTLPNTCMGMVYNFQHDTIYIPGTNNMHSITNADGRFGGSFTVNANTFTAGKDQSLTGGALTYTSLSAIDEGVTNRQTFIPTIEPLYSVKLYVTTKGSGSITVTIHDAANNSLGTATLAAGSMTNGQLNEWVFSAPLRMLASPNGASYHIHITHSGGTATTFQVATASDLETADYETYVSPFVATNNGMKPCLNFLQYICICNGRYLTVWEPISQSAPSKTEFVRHQLVFPPGFEGTSLTTWNEYLVIGCEKRSTSADNEVQEGKIFLWNGTSETYDDVKDVNEGSPYSLFSHKNVVHYWAGGGWQAWDGGQAVCMFQMPNTDNDYIDDNIYTINYPHMMAVRDNLLLGGFPSETNSTTLEHGVYSYGSRDKDYPESFGYSYTISSGSRTNGTLRIGCVKNFGDKLFIAWRDGSNYGVDKVDPNSDPFSEATYESRIFDNGRHDKQKLANQYKVSFKALPEGSTVTLKYKIDREASWHSGTVVTEGATEAKLNINKRFKEIQLADDWVATTTTPEIIGRVFIFDPLDSEKD